jgi:type VI secretion system protein ImpF
MLLFERLTDYQPQEPAEASPLRVYSREELRESIRREVGRLLNTRCPVPEERNGTVIDYGIPDFSWMSAASGDHRQQLANTIAAKVAAFEPRLEQVRVHLERDSADPRAIIGTIEGVLVVESIREAVSFPLLIHNKNGVMDVAPSEPESFVTSSHAG